MPPSRSASQRKEEGCPVTLCGLSEQDQECWFGGRDTRVSSFLPFFPPCWQLLLETPQTSLFHGEIPHLLFFLLFLFSTCLIQPHTGTWYYVCSPVVLAHSFPFKWLSGWSPPFHCPPDPQPDREGAQSLDCCLRDVYLPSAGEMPAHWTPESCRRNYPPEQGHTGESITPLQSLLPSLMLKKNVLEFSPRLLSE